MNWLRKVQAKPAPHVSAASPHRNAAEACAPQSGSDWQPQSLSRQRRRAAAMAFGAPYLRGWGGSALRSCGWHCSKVTFSLELPLHGNKCEHCVLPAQQRLPCPRLTRKQHVTLCSVADMFRRFCSPRSFKAGPRPRQRWQRKFPCCAASGCPEVANHV